MATENRLSSLGKIVFSDLNGLTFRKRGSVFFRDFAECRAVVEFQKSQKTTAEQIVFTMNISLVIFALLDAEFDDLDKMRGHEGHLFWRLGDFLALPEDKWWKLASDADEAECAAEITRLMRERVVPALVRYSAIPEVIKLWQSGVSPGISDKRRREFLAQLGR